VFPPYFSYDPLSLSGQLNPMMEMWINPDMHLLTTVSVCLSMAWARTRHSVLKNLYYIFIFS
jgi:hypothetical protein